MTQYTPSSSEPGQRPPNFWNASHGIGSWLFTLDHKRIGVMYLAFVWAAFMLGGVFALLVRTEEFSAEKGKQLFLKTKNWEGEDAPSCSSCHTDDPRQKGKHAASKKPILPLAPISNPDRFTNATKVEKNFSTHCQEIYSRDCDPAEKGHYLAYFLSVK